MDTGRHRQLTAQFGETGNLSTASKLTQMNFALAECLCRESSQKTAMASGLAISARSCWLTASAQHMPPIVRRFHPAKTLKFTRPSPTAPGMHTMRVGGPGFASHVIPAMRASASGQAVKKAWRHREICCGAIQELSTARLRRHGGCVIGRCSTPQYLPKMRGKRRRSTRS